MQTWLPVRHPDGHNAFVIDWSNVTEPVTGKVREIRPHNTQYYERHAVHFWAELVPAEDAKETSVYDKPHPFLGIGEIAEAPPAAESFFDSSVKFSLRLRSDERFHRNGGSPTLLMAVPLVGVAIALVAVAILVGERKATKKRVDYADLDEETKREIF